MFDACYAELLDRTGWEVTDQQDITAAYARTVGQRLRELETHSGAIEDLFGEAEAGEERTRGKANRVALERGLLRRESFSVVPASAAR